ncbi:hypothetical protein GJAV_G00007880 [Gymnothorax javanicus]|nr:hypothetical protein GJAV_G00007880 [Gymnothorax javanicus]
MLAKEATLIVRYIRIQLTLYTIGAVLSCFAAHGMTCSGFENANGSASYSFSDGLSSANCSTQWSDNGKVIAHIDEGKKAQLEEVLDHDVETLTLPACRRNVRYKKDCPESGVSIDVLCPCNCSDGDPNHIKVKGASNRNHRAVIVAVVIFGVVVFGLVCRWKCEIRTGTNASAGTRTV